MYMKATESWSLALLVIFLSQLSFSELVICWTLNDAFPALFSCTKLLCYPSSSVWSFRACEPGLCQLSFHPQPRTLAHQWHYREVAGWILPLLASPLVIYGYIPGWHPAPGWGSTGFSLHCNTRFAEQEKPGFETALQVDSGGGYISSAQVLGLSPSKLYLSAWNSAGIDSDTG